MRLSPIVCFGAAVFAVACAATSSPATTGTPTASPSSLPPGLDAITEADLKRDMFAMAGDAMRGREAGTLDEMRASMWVADRAREAGLLPAGDDGSYFQWWSMRRTRVSDASRVSIGGQALTLWKDVNVMNVLNGSVDEPITWIGTTTGADLETIDLRGKIVGALLPTPAPAPANPTLRTISTAVNAVLTARTRELTARGVSAIVLVSNDSPDMISGFERTTAARIRGTYGVDSVRTTTRTPPAGGRGGNANQPPPVPTIWVRHDLEDLVKSPGSRLTATFAVASFTYPSVNIVGKVPGTDPARRGEYVEWSGHQDHDGVRYTLDGDSIWNGADDNASVAVAMLGIARAVAKHPMPRTALFVWHGAEERGLLGSYVFARHPTVDKSQIVAVINGDMIGRNNPDSAALLGVQPPHKNSNALVDAAYKANALISHFIVDTSWDNPRHREGWYFRSDHLPYAYENIPAIMFSTLLHDDYHTPRDNPDRIDIPKLTRMAKWMYGTGWFVGTAVARPDVVPGFKLERNPPG